MDNFYVIIFIDIDMYKVFHTFSQPTNDYIKNRYSNKMGIANLRLWSLFYIFKEVRGGKKW